MNPYKDRDEIWYKNKNILMDIFQNEAELNNLKDN